MANEYVIKRWPTGGGMDPTFKTLAGAVTHCEGELLRGSSHKVTRMDVIEREADDDDDGRRVAMVTKIPGPGGTTTKVEYVSDDDE
jgi:hypothetical protein